MAATTMHEPRETGGCPLPRARATGLPSVGDASLPFEEEAIRAQGGTGWAEGAHRLPGLRSPGAVGGVTRWG